MKYLALIIFFVMVSMTTVFAQTDKNSSLSATPKQSSASAQTDDVQKLKEKIAKKVDELSKKDQRAISGVVDSVDKSNFTIIQQNGKPLKVTVDKELTKLYQITGTSKKERNIDDIEKGDFVIVAGPLTGDEVIANVVYIDEEYLVFSGRVVALNATDFTLDIVTIDQEEFTIDVETTTKRLLIDSKTLKSEVIGFSKIKAGDMAHIVVKKTASQTEKNRFTAMRVVILPQEYFIK